MIQFSSIRPRPTAIFAFRLFCPADNRRRCHRGGPPASFPVDRIKLAQEFIVDLATDPRHAAIVQAAIGLARLLGIDMIAEGVETEQQLDLLKSWGCRSAQGFYFAKPMSLEDITPLLRQGKIDRASQQGHDQTHASR